MVTDVETTQRNTSRVTCKHLSWETRWGWWLRWRTLEEEDVWWDVEGNNFGFESRCLCDLQVELLSRQLHMQVQGGGGLWPEDTDVGACVHQEAVSWDEIIWGNNVT